MTKAARWVDLSTLAAAADPWFTEWAQKYATRALARCARQNARDALTELAMERDFVRFMALAAVRVEAVRREFGL